MGLTQKQEAFCIAYIETGVGSDAYLKAYATKSNNRNVIKTQASKMLAMPKIRARLEELRAPAIKAANLTLEQHMADLSRLRDKADVAADYGAAIRAEVARGKAAGLYVEKIDVNLTGSLAERLARARSRNG